jgi:hypothetical protein
VRPGRHEICTHFFVERRGRLTPGRLDALVKALARYNLRALPSYVEGKTGK